MEALRCKPQYGDEAEQIRVEFIIIACCHGTAPRDAHHSRVASRPSSSRTSFLLLRFSCPRKST